MPELSASLPASYDTFVIDKNALSAQEVLDEFLKIKNPTSVRTINYYTTLVRDKRKAEDASEEESVKTILTNAHFAFSDVKKQRGETINGELKKVIKVYYG